MRVPLRPLLLATTLSAAACQPASPPAAPVTAQTPALQIVPAHLEARLDRPTFSWVRLSGAGRFTSAGQAVEHTLGALAPLLRLSARAQQSVRVGRIDDLGTGPIVARLEQEVGGLPVFRAGLRVALTRAFEPVAVSGFVAPSLTGADDPFVLDERGAVARALVHLGSSAVPVRSGGGDREAWFSATAFARPARARRVLFPVGDTRVEPAYYVELQLRDGRARSFVVSARDGGVRFENDLVHAASNTYRVYADPDSLLPYHSPQGNSFEPHPTGVPDGSRPAYVPSQLVTLSSLPFSRNDPWLPNDATSTVGNNVDAYADRFGSDGYSPADGDVRADVTSPTVFDHSYDPGASPGATPANVTASVTQLFYVMNFLHDWFYDAGFDEASGNHQASNLGRGGKEGDPLLAEAQDFSGRNNSDALVPSDGSSPRVQMFVFSGQSNARLEVTAPAGIAGDKEVGIGGFGTDSFALAGSVVLATDDQGTDVNDACEALTNDVTGKIAIVHRGVCSFVQKAVNAQAAGAIGMLAVNVASSSDPSTPPYMGGTSNDVHIPVLSLALADGAALEAALATGVTVVMHRSLLIDLDGALDTNIVAHEWGHVLSGRLIGDGNGLTTNQAGGLNEGWSDFVALLLTSRAEQPTMPHGANWEGVYPSAPFASSGGGTDYYFGLRRVPYSTDFSKDPLTFKHIQNGTPIPSVPVSFGEDGSFNAEVHNTGEVWATMLWECYTGLLRAGSDFNTSQEKMKRYLVAAMKLTPVDPTLLEARDALLAAALATNADDFQVLFGAFARRGAGVGAIGPARDSGDNKGVTESFAFGNDVQIVSAVLRDDQITCDRDGILDEGEYGTLEAVVRNSGVGALSETRLVVSSPNAAVLVDHGGSIAVPPLSPLQSATVKLGLRIHGGTPADKVSIDVAASDPTLAVPHTVHLILPTRYHADEGPEASTNDAVDTAGTSWDVSASDGSMWERVRQGDEGWWRVLDSTLTSDPTLTSPGFALLDNTFTLSFRHRWSFRRSTRRMVDIDGGVIEISTDGGNTWEDIGKHATVDYNTTLDATRTTNVLAGRAAYGHTSAGYPGTWVTSKISVGFPSNPGVVRIRFRVGVAGGGFAGSPGWEIDDVALDGLATRPFWGFLPSRDACDPNAPVAIAGDDQHTHARYIVKLAGGGESASASPIAFHWLQTEGPAVTLEGDDRRDPRFIAPDVAEPVTLRFALRVDDGKLLSPADDVTVLVSPGGSGCSMGSSDRAGGLLFVVAALWIARRRRRHA